MNSSRRNFLAAGLALPAAGLAQAPAPGALSYQKLGRTALTPTRVAFGCMITSDQSVVEKAADLGINYFDTARGYQGGNNERMVGAALKAKRKQVYISSKSHARDKAEAIQNLETSLRTLGTDYLDIWYLHGVSSADDLNPDLLEAQQAAKKDGKIRFTGVSTHSGQASVIDGAIQCGKIDVVLLAYNFTMDPAIEAALDRARNAGIGLVAMKVMAGGFRRVKPDNKFYSTLKREGAMPAALRWVLKNPKIDTTIPSMTDMDQLDENLKTMNAKFTEADEKILSAHLEHIGPLYCRMCGKCSGTCSQGLPVADVLRCLTYADGYGQFALGRERFLELPGESRIGALPGLLFLLGALPERSESAPASEPRAGTLRMKLAAGLFLVCLAALGQTPDCSLVPGWTQQGAARSHVADNLFEYMDGNAEGYLIYGFVRMQGLNCQSGEDTIIFDVSEMADAESAYGIFSANRDPRSPMEKLGMGGQIVPRRAIFAKDKYYVEIAISKDAPEVLRAFSRAIENKIPGRTELPEALAWFPTEKLARETVRLVPESVLGLRLLKRGYIAQYEYGKAFIVAETSPETAAEVMQKLRARIGETQLAKVADEAFQANDRYLGRLCFFRKGRYLAGFAGLADGQDAVALGTVLAARIP